MDIKHVSHRRFLSATTWSLIGSTIIVIGAAGIGRATLNMSAALTEKPDLAVILLLPEEEISEVKLLRDITFERDYLVETKNGSKFVKLQKIDGEWTLAEVEELHEDE